jgi:hypothetical protein
MKLPKELRENREIRSKDNKGKICSVKECNEVALRSLSENKWNKYMEKAKLKINENKRHKIYLCKVHYKQINKIRKSEEKLYGQQKGFLQDSKGSKKGRWDSY